MKFDGWPFLELQFKSQSGNRATARRTMTDPIRDGRAMIAGMTPTLEETEFVYCTASDSDAVAKAQSMALGWFREREGVSLILERSTAATLGFDVSLPVRRIVLQVHSALDGVGLTAAVSAALCAEAIPCNVVAAYHHDHIFVPSAMAQRALEALKRIQSESAGRL
jgi:hypothetical protein